MPLVSWLLFLFVFVARLYCSSAPLPVRDLSPTSAVSSLPPCSFLALRPCLALPLNRRLRLGWCRHRSPPRVSAFRHSTAFMLLLLLCGDVEPNPGPPQPTGTSIKCVCTSSKEEGTMLQWEACLAWSHCKCVRIPVSLAPTNPFVCPFCIKATLSSLKLKNNCQSGLSHLTPNLLPASVHYYCF